MFKQIVESADRVRPAGDAMGVGHGRGPEMAINHYFGPKAKKQPI